ncbi:flagellar protein [Alteribacter keqinensis]|uniref:Flagellar protein FliT n=1 Tax=Alteribacter keqinensis TaxID=2483800 RepID=A0A3M7TQ33_9BACI|nr:flagellar protein [Alteribacter keqinensis]RNA67555.1 flagellar protein [Alteribacter keqinensis]
MTRVQELYTITKSLHDYAKERPEPDERGAFIERLTDMLEERGEVLAGLEDYSDEERAVLKEAVDMNSLIEERLQEELRHIKMDMNELKRKKTTGRRYENPYGESGPVDGAFIDRKN